MIIKSFAKINLSLSVNKKLKSGLHNIQSYFCLINLFDEVKIKKIEGLRDIVKFQGKFGKHVKKLNNSILDTLVILRKNKMISNYYSIVIRKRIPVFAGLGGGTSNAVFLIKYFIKNKVSKNILNILEKKIGSDIRLFFYDQGFLQNLKRINNFKKKHKLYFLLVYPNIKCSTRYIYSKVSRYSSKLKYDFKKTNSKNKFITLLLNRNNDLQSIVEKKYPIIRKLLTEIDQKKGCYFSRITGSGSVCYGLFESEKRAKVALKKIKSKHPKFWVSFAKTI